MKSWGDALVENSSMAIFLWPIVILCEQSLFWCKMEWGNLPGIDADFLATQNYWIPFGRKKGEANHGGRRGGISLTLAPREPHSHTVPQGMLWPAILNWGILPLEIPRVSYLGMSIVHGFTLNFILYLHRLCFVFLLPQNIYFSFDH